MIRTVSRGTIPCCFRDVVGQWHRAGQEVSKRARRRAIVRWQRQGLLMVQGAVSGHLWTVRKSK